MGNGRDFEALMSKLPFDKDTILSKGMSWFISNQDPENVEFKKASNGYQITVYTDEENAQDALDFWKNHVEPKLGGDD
jgi:hypothetical protein